MIQNYFFNNDTATTEIYTLSLHDALPIFGTTNSEMPFTPGGPPGIFASTRWTMFSVSSWSPPEIHILLPERRYVPSSCGSALVVMSASEDPAWGSESAIVPNQRPSSSGRT